MTENRKKTNRIGRSASSTAGMLAGLVVFACAQSKKDDCSVLTSYTDRCPSGGEGGENVGGTQAGTGGTGPVSGNGGSGGGPPPLVPVFTSGEERNESDIPHGDWQVDSVLGAHSGKTALHPPEFDAGDTFSFSFDCGGKKHTQLRFMLAHEGGSVSLELQVDGEQKPRVLPQTVGFNLANGYFAEQVIDVERGSHQYTFKATSASDSPPRVRLDSFKCFDVEPFAAENHHVDFDDSFIPLEISGEWQIDNLLGVAEGDGEGDTAIHPPAFKAGDEYAFDLTCDSADHSQLRFLLAHEGGSVALNLKISGEDKPRVLPQTVGFNLAFGYFAEQVIDVKPGPHTYTFTASSESDSPPRVRLDSFKCLGVEPFPAENDHVDMDDGFIPLEVIGDWQVDNLLGVADGDSAIHPPAFVAGDTYSFHLTCEAEAHRQLRFLLAHEGGGVALDLQVSGEDEPRVLPQAVGFNLEFGYFAEQLIDVDPGPHVYTFSAFSPSDSPPRVRIDSFVCR